MPRFIIASGRNSELDIIEAKDRDDALMKATERSMLDGCLDDDLADTTWVENYSDDLAHEYGLRTYDEPTSFRDALNRANAPPWR